MGKESSTVSRRGFLKFAGKTAAVSAGLLAGCAPASIQPAGKTDQRRGPRHRHSSSLLSAGTDRRDQKTWQSSGRHRVFSAQASQR